MAATKFLLNSCKDAVTDMLQGLSLHDENLTLCSERMVVLRHQIHQDQVQIISGGGSGHEPFAAAYVGEGMLSGAVVGEIFTSPATGNIEAAVNALCKASSKGVLAIVANYTGDVLNFGIGCERVQAHGHRVETVIVGEDCAYLELGRTNLTGRRGTCGIVLVIKVAGAMAALGLDLGTISKECQKVSENMATLGVCLEPCTIPGNGPLFQLGPDEIDIGLGIHGEAGISRHRLATGKTVVETLLRKICHHLQLNVHEKSSVCILINNLGIMIPMEMDIIRKEIYDYFYNTKVSIRRLYSGPIMTSLNMKGFQICILKVANDVWLQYLDAETQATGWPRAPNVSPYVSPYIEVDEAFSFKNIEKIPGWDKIKIENQDVELVQDCLMNIASEIKLKVPVLNEMDKTCGDGDCGSTLGRLGEVLCMLASEYDFIIYPTAMCKYLEHWAEFKMGGTSGALYSLFFIGAGNYCLTASSLDWGAIFCAGVNGILKYSKARQGDGTMLDVLIECQITLYNKQMIDTTTGRFVTSYDNLKALIDKLILAYTNTRDMIPRAGRASNVDAKLVKTVDAGAYGAYLWIRTIIDTIMQHKYPEKGDFQNSLL